MDTLTKARGLFILMWQNITKTITMESFPDVIWTMLSILPVNLTDSRKNIILPISPSGNVPSRNISCAGRHRGVMASRDGTVNVLLWDASI